MPGDGRTPEWDAPRPFWGSSKPVTLPRRPSRANSVLGAIVAVALFALFLSVAAFRPSVTITSSTFFTTVCDNATATQHVIAVFNLTNSGRLATTVGIQLWVDGRPQGLTYFQAPAADTVQGRLSAASVSCGYHRYGLTLCYASGDTGGC